ncbi:MAG TPA: condensation domain-containing protein, partial [Candidatus Nanopelagicales bacterium]|nr:condensation domain-containing protein [Candidatus Nanopelagicales bacterium]
MIDLNFIRRLQAAGVELWLEGDAVRFRAPRGALTPELREELKLRKESIRRFLESTAAGGAAGLPEVTPAPRDGALPLSFAQQRLWLLDRIDPGSPLYNVPAALRLSGVLSVEALRQSFAEVVRRHESLRTTFAMRDGNPIQVIDPPPPAWDLPIVDLSHLPGALREDAARRRADEEARRPFHLATGPLLRTTLLRLDEREHVLCVTMQHIVSDEWSIGVLVKEIIALYTAFTEGRPSPLPELPIQYADYAAWQRGWLSGDVLEEQLGYWRARLAGAPPLELPTDRPRSTQHGSRGAEHPVRIPAELGEALSRFAQQRGATLFMTLLAAFQGLLSRYSGQQDFCVGTPVAGRNRAEIEPLIGFFVNTLVMRADLSQDPSFTELLDRTRKATLEALAHQDLPFERLIDALGVTRDLGQNPLFQVMFVLQGADAEAPRLPGLSVETLPLATGTSKFDLTLVLEERDDGLGGYLQYSTDLFDEPTIARMAGHFQVLLASIVADPERRIGELQILPAADLRLMLEAWNATEVDYPRDRCIHELFEAQVARAPDAAALLFGSTRMSYGELDRRANQLSNHLRSLGVGPGTLVGMSIERSVEMAVAVLGILKAGGAYVPLDPTYPRERLAFMVEEIDAPVLLTQASLVDRLPAHESTVVRLDADRALIAASRAEPPPRAAGPGDLAYVIYTSGSTGTPKGVLLEHRGACNLASFQRRTFGVGPGVHVLQFANFGFDASVWEMLMALCWGATLCLGDSAALMPGPDLARTLREMRVNVVTLPPSALSALPLEPLPELRTIVVAGEACPAELVEQWAPERRFFNAYGPT